MSMCSHQTLTKNRARSAVEGGWRNFISDNNIEAFCCNGNCFARIVKTTKNILPPMPSFEPPSLQFISENTQNINKSLKFLESTLECLVKSDQRTNIFSTTNLALNQLVEIVSNFEGFFNSIITDKMKLTDLTLNTLTDTSVSSHTSGLGFASSSKSVSNLGYRSETVPQSHIQRYNEFNYVLLIFLYSIDRIQHFELDNVFMDICGLDISDVSMIDIGDVFLSEWRNVMIILSSINTSFLTNNLNNTCYTINSLNISNITTEQQIISINDLRKHNNLNIANDEQSEYDDYQYNSTLKSNFQSLRKISSMSDGVAKRLNNEFENLKKRNGDEFVKYQELVQKIKEKLNELDFNHKIKDIQTILKNNTEELNNTSYFHQIPLIFSFHNMMNIQCVCHGPNDYHKYTLNFHLEAGRPIDIIRYIVKIRLHYYNDSNCATQVDMFLVTYRSFISLQKVVEILLAEVYTYFPDQYSEPHHLFYGSTILLIDVISNIFETGTSLGDYFSHLWKLMYFLILKGKFNLALALRKSLQNYSNTCSNKITNLNIRASMNVEIHYESLEPKVALKKLMNLSPSDIAAQITHTDEEVFHSINLAEILHWFHLKYNKNPVNIESVCGKFSVDDDNISSPSISSLESSSYRKACINMNRSTIRFHFINNLTLKIINSTIKKSKKIKRIEFLLKLLEALFNLGNIHSAFAVYTGISSSKNSKIISTIISNNQEFNNIWFKLTQMTDMTHSYEAYRSVVNNLQAPFIPYLGITMTDINMLKFSMKDYMKDTNIFETESKTKTHSLIALTPKNITKINEEVLFKGVKLPSHSFDMSNLDEMVNVRKLWRYFNVLRCNITKPRLVHYNISIDKFIQTLLLSCDQLEIVN